MAKKKIRLNENTLRKVVRESISMMMNEDYRKGVQFINESMQRPNYIEKVWVSNKFEDGFLVKGPNDDYYVLYPTHNDGYKVNSDFDEWMEGIERKIRQAFANHGINAMTTYMGDELIVEIRSNGYNGEFDKPLAAWLNKLGIVFDRKDDTYNANIYKIPSRSEYISPDRLNNLLKDYTDITDMMEPYIYGWDTYTVCHRLDYFYKKAKESNGGGIKPGVNLGKNKLS